MISSMMMCPDLENMLIHRREDCRESHAYNNCHLEMRMTLVSSRIELA